MNILWVSWKDINNPAAGGAERISYNLQKFLSKDNKIILITSGWKGCDVKTVVNENFEIVRVGSIFTIGILAIVKYLKIKKENNIDLIIEEINTIPFFFSLFFRKKTIVLFYQLCKKVWFYQLPPPFSFIGYIFELFYLQLYKHSRVLTESESTKSDLVNHGFRASNIKVFQVSIDPPEHIPNERLHDFKYLLSCNNLRPMKRVSEQVKAFFHLKKDFPDLKLIIAGSAAPSELNSLNRLLAKSPHKKDVIYIGKVSESDKYRLYRDAELLLITSCKEGWGLTVTEANYVGSIAAGYNVDGIRDSIRNKYNGVLSDESPISLAEKIGSLLVNNALKATLEQNALKWSKEFTDENLHKSYLLGLCALLDPPREEVRGEDINLT
ncbi:glycosyltransferase family 4 protein [Polynucleobacter paneuropaeus]|nr:glycosyltransferase family 4 protein [Polynucleobacter paneuropaeus]